MKAKTTTPIADAITELNKAVKRGRSRFSCWTPMACNARAACSLIAGEPYAYLAALAAA
jgi:hypothetical protein